MRLVFLDLDGTLLNSSLELSERNARALARAAEAGVAVVLASGRPTASIARFASRLPGKQFLIASNGGATVEFPELSVLGWSEMPERSVGAVLAIAERHAAACCLYGPLRWYAERWNAFVDIEMRRSGTTPEWVGDYAGLDERWIKALVIGERQQLAGCEAAFSAAKNLGIEWFYTYPEYLEVMPRGVSKGRACRRLRKLLGFTASQAMAIGDGENDSTMLEEAGVRVAVANASESLISKADYLVPSNDDDGVAIAVEALVLRDERARDSVQEKARDLASPAPPRGAPG